MKWYLFVILILSFVLGKYFQKKASEHLKDEYKNSWSNRNTKYPMSFFADAYKSKEGIKYKNLTIIIPVIGFFLMVILSLLNH